MAFFDWSDTMSVGVPAVDGDHKVLISLINQLNAAVGASDEPAVLGSVLNTLVDYTTFHFMREEKIMEAAGYPRLLLHKEQHEDLTARVIDIQCRHEEGGDVLRGSAVLEFLKDWLTTHILKQDMDYRPFVIGNEAASRAAESVSLMESMAERA